MKRFCKLVSDYMGMLVLLSALAALLFPDTLGHLKPRLINPPFMKHHETWEARNTKAPKPNLTLPQSLPLQC